MAKIDELKKGFYSLFSSHENDLGKVSKKGSEIKQGIANILSTLVRTKGELLTKMNSEIGEIPFAPDIEPYYNKEYKHLLGWIPKRFSYDMINSGEQYIKTDNGIKEQAINKPTDEQACEMREYNKYADQYVDSCVNELKLTSLKNNLDDKKSYNLTIDQLTILGI